MTDWFDRLPKVELHLHLEGAIPLPALWQLVQKYDGDPALPDLQAMTARFQYRDFPQFIDTWVWKNGFLRELDDFAFVAEAVARRLAEQNVRYVEAFYSPPDFHKAGLSTQDLTASIRAGLDRVADVEVRLVCDLVRDFGPDRAARTLDELADVRDHGVIGIGIGGSEHEFPPEPFAEVYERARSLGLRTSAHAGEAAGADSIWGAINSLRVDRIGHATRAREDAALVDYLAEHQIPLEMCPMSNVRTNVVSSLAQHPVADYHRRGLAVCINTDDPVMFQTSLADEYRQLCAVHGLDRGDIVALRDAAVAASWLSAGEKAELLRQLHADDPAG